MGVKAGAYVGQDRFDCRNNLWVDMESAVSFLACSVALPACSCNYLRRIVGSTLLKSPSRSSISQNRVNQMHLNVDTSICLVFNMLLWWGS